MGKAAIHSEKATIVKVIVYSAKKIRWKALCLYSTAIVNFKTKIGVKTNKPTGTL